MTGRRSRVAPPRLTCDRLLATLVADDPALDLQLAAHREDC